MKKLLGLIIALGVLATSVFAIPSDIQLFSGDVAPLNAIVVTATGGATFPGLGPAAISGQQILDYVITNNDPDGFTMTLSSANSGKLYRGGTVSALAGDFVTYTINIVADVNAAATEFLGCDEAANLPDVASHDFSGGNLGMTYSANLATATHDYKYLLKVNLPQKHQLFNGNFEDTLTLTIADI